MSNFLTWLKDHSTAILGTLVAVSKAGVLGKVAVTLGTAIGASLGMS